MRSTQEAGMNTMVCLLLSHREPYNDHLRPFGEDMEFEIEYNF